MKEEPTERQKTAAASSDVLLGTLLKAKSRHPLFQRYVVMNIYMFCPVIAIQRMWGF